jgi:hypothetical protein
MKKKDTGPKYVWNEKKYRVGATRVCLVCNRAYTVERPTQEVCDFECAAIYYHNLKKKSRRAAKEIARQVDRKSIAEVEFDAHLVKEVGREKYIYEPDSFEWIPPTKPRHYTPDYRFKKKTKGYMYVEYKGRLDLDTRKKMESVKAQHPTLDIRLIFKKPNNKIYKGSPTTYYQWALDHGFKVSEDAWMPEAWKKEIKK